MYVHNFYVQINISHSIIDAIVIRIREFYNQQPCLNCELLLGLIKIQTLQILFRQLMIYKTMSQDNNSQSSINTGGLRSTPNKKYTKFDANFKKQISIERSHGIFDKEERDENSSKMEYSNQGIVVEPFKAVSKIRSESSLSGVKGTRRIPLTPRKEKGSDRKSRPHALKQALIKIRLALKDFQKLQIQIENIIRSALQTFMKQMQQSIKQFIEGQLANFIEEKKLHSKIALEPKNFQKFNDTQQSSLQQRPQINQSNSLESPIKDSILRALEAQSYQKSNTFSSTIHLRERLRQNATNAILKTSFQQPSKNMARRPDNNKSPMASPCTRNASRSIQKLQTHLSSLKKLLNE